MYYVKHAYEIYVFKCIEAVFNQENEWNINFFQISFLDIQRTYFSEFSIGWSTAESLLEMKRCCPIYLNILYVLKSDPWNKFSLQ